MFGVAGSVARRKFLFSRLRGLGGPKSVVTLPRSIIGMNGFD